MTDRKMFAFPAFRMRPPFLPEGFSLIAEPDGLESIGDQISQGLLPA